MLRAFRASLFMLALAGALAACASHSASVDRESAESSDALGTHGGLGFADPDQVGMDAQPLIDLANWIRTGNQPVFSILVSKNGKVVFELYTSSLTRAHAHYLMSVTKSVTSALVGVAIQEGILGPASTTSVADALPAEIFASPSDVARFQSVTVRDVLGMSALDAQVPPHRNLPQDQARQTQFNQAPNRTAFALTQAILPTPGASFQYTDITPLLATGMIQYASGTTTLAYAEAMLFGPMQFANYEWMHQDATGIDNGAYGLRLRPIDMQKFGVLYLRGGAWEGRQLVPRAWVKQSFTPWIRSAPNLPAPDYGWYWWTSTFAPHWTGRLALGWKGQRIAVFPEQNVVVTMTGLEEDPNEPLFGRVMRDYVIPATTGTAGQAPHPDATLRAPLHHVLEQVRTSASRIPPNAESRMVPSITNKEAHHPFSP